MTQTVTAAAKEDQFETEKFHGAEVSRGESVFKLEHCDTDDRKAFLLTAEKLAKEVTGDDATEVSSVGEGCWFLARSGRLSTSEILNKFQSKIQLNLNSAPTASTAPQIVHVEPNFIIRITGNATFKPATISPDDDYFKDGKLWGLNNQEHPGFDIDAVRTWENYSKGDKSVVVGVIDTGIYYLHPDLLTNVWSAPKGGFHVTFGAEDISCPEGSHGFNALGRTEQERCDPLDGVRVSSGHGTQVSGIIGAVGDNHIGVIGVNWSASLLGIKFIGTSGGGTAANAARAIDFAVALKRALRVKANIRVLNASWGYHIGEISPDATQLLRDKIENAGRNGILFVAAAGEDDGGDDDAVKHYPSGFDLPNVISVTGIDPNGALASLCNFGLQSVDLSAPGSDIYSTYSINLGDYYYVGGGTSMAAPFVSGAAALVLSVPKCSALSPSELKAAILRGTVRTRAPIKTETGGMLNVYRSVERCR